MVSVHNECEEGNVYNFDYSNFKDKAPSSVTIDGWVGNVHNFDNIPNVDIDIANNDDPCLDTFLNDLSDNYPHDYIVPNCNAENKQTFKNFISYYYTNIDQLAIKSTSKMDEHC